MRAKYKNEDNEDYICIIKSLDERHQAWFIVIKDDHEWNRQYAKNLKENHIGIEWRKV